MSQSEFCWVFFGNNTIHTLFLFLIYVIPVLNETSGQYSVCHPQVQVAKFYLSAKKVLKWIGRNHQKPTKERAGSGGEGRGEIQQLMRPQTFVH